jgi:RNA polymerase sigma-70 factor (ECF subfamily)
MAEQSDDFILELIGNKSSREKGLNLLVEKYKERIYWHIRRLIISPEDSEDVMQETFINIFRFIDSFQRESKLYTWLYKIATNECLKHFRKRKSIFTSLNDKGAMSASETVSFSSEDGDELLKRFQKAVAKLPEKQRIVFNLRYYDELPYEEISEILNTNTGSLKTSYHYAYEKVKNELLNNNIL